MLEYFTTCGSVAQRLLSKDHEGFSSCNSHNNSNNGLNNFNCNFISLSKSNFN